MTKSIPRPYSDPPPIEGLRVSILSRRVSASGPLAVLLTEMVFGQPRRDDVSMLANCVACRVADTMEAR